MHIYIIFCHLSRCVAGVGRAVDSDYGVTASLRTTPLAFLFTFVILEYPLGGILS